MSAIVIVSLISLALLILLSLWLSYKKLTGQPIPTAVIVLLLIFSSCNAAVCYFVYPKEDFQAYKQLQWQPLVPTEIATLVKQGNTVFIDVTADWCSICKRNKDSVLNREVIVQQLAKSHVILMRGDLSQPNPRIEAFLQSQGQSGIPYNRVYGPNAPNGVVLPGSLTITDVEQTLAYVQ